MSMCPVCPKMPSIPCSFLDVSKTIHKQDLPTPYNNIHPSIGKNPTSNANPPPSAAQASPVLDNPATNTHTKAPNIDQKEIYEFQYVLNKDKKCKTCNCDSDTTFNGTFTAEGFPQYTCHSCQLLISPRIWPPTELVNLRKRVRPSPPSPEPPRPKAPNNTDVDLNRQFQSTIDSLQTTIKHLTALIAELTPLKTTVPKLEQQMDQIAARQNQLEDSLNNEAHQHLQATAMEIPAQQSGPVAKEQPAKPDPNKKSYSTAVKASGPKKKARRVETAKATFQPPPLTPKQFEMIYIPSRHRLTRAAARLRLRSLGIHTHRIIDIHFPARNLIAMLVHEDYGVTIRQTLDSHQVPVLNLIQQTHQL
ncbi:unnamed protein product [Absidia cylindrospora]